MKSNLKEKILADFRYEQGAPLYGKTFLLNLIMLSLSAICLFFGILNYMYDDYNASAVNFVSAFSSLVIWLYYRYTGNFKISGLINTDIDRNAPSCLFTPLPGTVNMSSTG